MTWVGELSFEVLQVQNAGFYPSALHPVTHTGQAINIALTEMYVQGVSTRKVCDILVKLVASEVSISSTQVSRAEAGHRTGCLARPTAG